MPERLDAPVLTVDLNIVHTVDTANPQNLHSMWSIFSRCAESVEHGRRLENLSWRMWQRAQFCCDSTATESTAAQTSPRDIPRSPHVSSDLPQLSGSVDSADEEAVEYTTGSAPLDFSRPRIRRQDSTTSSTGRHKERHITSDDFEKMIMSIIQPKGSSASLSVSFSAPDVAVQSHPADTDCVPSTCFSQENELTSARSSIEPFSPPPVVQANVGPTPSQFQASSCIQTVVNGFGPLSTTPRPSSAVTGKKPVEVDSRPNDCAKPAPMDMVSKKQPARFALGGSCSSTDPDPSFDGKGSMSRPGNSKTFRPGGSRASQDESALKSALHSSTLGPGPSAVRKQTSFSDHVTTRTIEPAVAANEDQSETDGDCVDESAIEDDSDWEDSPGDCDKSSVIDSLFQRVDSRPVLTSRRSLITLGLERDNRIRASGNAASHPTTLPRPWSDPCKRSGAASVSISNECDDATLMMRTSSRQPTLKTINESGRSGPQPILMLSHQPPHPQAVLSPRSTRKKMLATELTDSLRRSLLWERQQKTSTVNAVLKRRHTSQDVVNLKQYPGKGPKLSEEDSETTSWNVFFSKDAFSGYHTKGW